jgi:pilus assembly protein Flp/PilA
MSILSKIRRFLESDDGPTAVEYAVMIALIVGVCIGAVNTFAVATRDNFDRSATAIDNALNP